VAAVRFTLRGAGALLLAATAVLHGRLWLDGYRSIDVIGPLFALDTVLAVVAATALLVTPRRHLGVVALAGAALAAGTAGGLLLSTQVALFGFRESLAASDARLSLVLEGAATVVLLVLAALSLRRRPGGRRGAVSQPAHRAADRQQTARWAGR
jgi:hypothetical protein